MPFAFPTIEGGGSSGGGSTYPTHRRGYKAPDVHHIRRIPPPTHRIPPPTHRIPPSIPAALRFQFPVPPVWRLPPVLPAVSAPVTAPAPAAAPSGGGDPGLPFMFVALAPLLIAFLLGKRR